MKNHADDTKAQRNNAGLTRRCDEKKDIPSMNTPTLIDLLHGIHDLIDGSAVTQVEITRHGVTVDLHALNPAKAHVLQDFLDTASGMASLTVNDIPGDRVRLILSTVVPPHALAVTVYATYSRRTEPDHVAAIDRLAAIDARQLFTRLIELSPTP